MRTPTAPWRTAIVRTRASIARAVSRYNEYRTGNTSGISEASFQYDVVTAATMNGWRIDLSHSTIDDIKRPREAPMRPYDLRTARVAGHLKRCFPRAGLKKVTEFLLARKRNIFTLCYHTHDSRNSQKGFPDLVLVHPERRRVIFSELKDDKSYPSTEQRLWAAGLMCVSEEYPDAVTYRLWKPKMYAQIIEELGGIDPLMHL